MNQLGVDYARLGKTIADNIPLQKAVNVMVDQNGITIDDDGNRSVVLNKKYSATWI
jgi:hypothetical protein